MTAYAAVALLSAFLLFLVQPLIAKAILPWFGGAPAVWTTCLLFFQSALLAGYAYTHVTRRLPPRRQIALHLFLLALTLVFLPILPAPSWKPAGTESPVWRILALLTATVGAPYLLLATSAPLLQEWYRHESRATPYRLYAWSNAGSLIALLGYPFALERLLAVPQQAQAWSILYLAFIAGCGWIAVRVWRQSWVAPGGVDDSTGETMEPAPAMGDLALWFALAACGSGLLMAITNQLSLDVAAVPFLWVVPLSLYLITFILCFGGFYRRALWRPAFILGLGIMAVLYKLGAGAGLPSQIAGSAFALFGGCMICHGELVRLAPRSRYLTTFYLTMAAGGAAGGVLVAVVAPLVFSDFWELPIFLITPYVLMAIAVSRESPQTRRPLTWLALGAIVWLGAAAFLIPAWRDSQENITTRRNFYGVLHVLVDRSDLLNPMRQLRHGRIAHGSQFIAPDMRDRTTAYYGLESGVELAIDDHPLRLAGKPLQIGAIGLGVGTIAMYGTPVDSFRFFEINPDVEQLARRYFSFLEDTKSPVQVVLGDGRLSLERELEQREHRYDVLVVDAFSGDAIPVHLLTVEAMADYWRALKGDGILALHVSNRYLNLTRVVSGLAPKFRKRLVRIRVGSGLGTFGSTWLLVTSNQEFLRWVSTNVEYGADIPAEPPVVWTDAFSNLYDVLGEEES